MSRVGKYPVQLPDGFKAELISDSLVISHNNKSISLPLNFKGLVNVVVKDNAIEVTLAKKNKMASQAWGTMRALIQNAVIGLKDGFKKRLVLKGVGYRVKLTGQNLTLQLGFSHDIVYKMPEGITFVVENNTIVVSGMSKEKVGQVASEIRAFRPPEPYKGKGVRYENEYIIRKEGKKK